MSSRRPPPAASRRRRFSPVPPNADVRSGPPAVLIVDDDFDARMIYSQYLRAMGCLVLTANNGRMAVDKAVDLVPDVVVMDLAMPVVDGWEAIRQLRESSWTRRVLIIALSAVPVSREAAFAAGCDAYLTKPCEPDVLWAQIQALLRLDESGRR